MVCQGEPEWNTALNISAVFVRNYTAPVEEAEGGITGGGIAGIVIACIVAALFITILIFSLRGTLWFKNLCKCCRNKTQNLDNDQSERQQIKEGDVERKDTGLAQGSDLALQPHSAKNGPSHIDPEMAATSQAEMNSTS
jgi:hypothetical protein